MSRRWIIWLCGAVALAATAAGAQEVTSASKAAAFEGPVTELPGTPAAAPAAAAVPTSASAAADVLSLDDYAEDAGSTSALDLNLHERLHWSVFPGRGGKSLDAVLQTAARANPNWGAFAANHAAAHAEVIQAGLYPNPEIGTEFGRARLRDADDDGDRPRVSVWSLSVSQPVELPGKRIARRIEAEAGFAVIAGEAAEYSSTLRAEVTEAYYTVQYYTGLATLHETLVEVAERLLEVARVRIELGVAGRSESLNARVELLRTRRELKAAQRKALAAKAALNALTGGALGPRFTLSGGFPERLPAVSLEGSVKTALACHPRLGRLAAELEQRYAKIDRERTAWWPDLRLGAQQNRDFESDSTALTASVEIPLWNRNQGGIAKAEAEAQRKYNDIVVAMNELRHDAEAAWQNYEMGREQVASYTDGLKEAAQEALQIAYLQYSEGTASYLDLLTARRVLQETEQEYLEALFNASTARARLDRVRGEVIRGEPADKRPIRR